MRRQPFERTAPRKRHETACVAVLRSGPAGPGRTEVQDIVPGGEQHEEQDQCEPDPEPDLLRVFSLQRAAANGLERVEQQVPAIEEGNRKKVKQADRDGEKRHETDEPPDATDLGDLARDARDPDRTGELIGAIRGPSPACRGSSIVRSTTK